MEKVLNIAVRKEDPLSPDAPPAHTAAKSRPVGVEQRKKKRVVLKRQVTINNSLKVMGLDLSEGGVYVHTGRSITPGTMSPCLWIMAL